VKKIFKKITIIFVFVLSLVMLLNKITVLAAGEDYLNSAKLDTALYGLYYIARFGKSAYNYDICVISIEMIQQVT
jgi:hypothetical protein